MQENDRVARLLGRFNISKDEHYSHVRRGRSDRGLTLQVGGCSDMGLTLQVGGCSDRGPTLQVGGCSDMGLTLQVGGCSVRGLTLQVGGCSDRGLTLQVGGCSDRGPTLQVGGNSTDVWGVAVALRRGVVSLQPLCKGGCSDVVLTHCHVSHPRISPRALDLNHVNHQREPCPRT